MKTGKFCTKMKISDVCNKISPVLQALWCAVLYFIIEAISRHSIAEAWQYMTGKPLVFAYNTAFIHNNADRVSVSQKIFLAYIGIGILAVPWTCKWDPADEQGYAIYRAGSAYAYRWIIHYAEVSACLWSDPGLHPDRTCADRVVDPAYQGTEIQKEDSIQICDPADSGRNCCFWRYYTACP